MCVDHVFACILEESGGKCYTHLTLSASVCVVRVCVCVCLSLSLSLCLPLSLSVSTADNCLVYVNAFASFPVLHCVCGWVSCLSLSCVPEETGDKYRILLKSMQ